MATFEELVAARKGWIESVLKPWCQQARRPELLKAELEWTDIAGKVAPEKTLWLWAWSRFPDLIHESLGIEETSQVHVRTKAGNEFIGYPDSRKSLQGRLVIWGGETDNAVPRESEPFSIDDIEFVRRGTSEV